MKLPEELQFIANGRAKQHSTVDSAEGKTVVITGATSGVGLSAAERFVRGGARIVMVCRNAEKAKAVQSRLQTPNGPTVDIVLADFARLDDVRNAADTLLSRYPRIDVLINNAGVHCTRRELTEDGYERVFAVNHLAPFLFTRLLLPRMQESAPSRIIQVNSQGHRFNGLRLKDWNWEKRFYTGLRSYGQSKTAQLMTVWKMADELVGSGVSINAMHPGSVHSGIGTNNGLLYRLFKKYTIDLTLDDPSVSGEALYWLAIDPAQADASGNFYNLTILEKPASHALNPEIGQGVWELSEQLTGLSQR